MKMEDALIFCLKDLCLRYSGSGDPLDGRYEVARRSGLSEQYLYQILAKPAHWKWTTKDQPPHSIKPPPGGFFSSEFQRTQNHYSTNIHSRIDTSIHSCIVTPTHHETDSPEGRRAEGVKAPAKRSGRKP